MGTGTYITRRNGSANFYARILVPDDIKKTIGRAEIWTSLRTPDEKEARRRSAPVFAKHLADFDALRRTRPATDADLQQAAYDHYVAELEQDRVSRSMLPKEADFDRMKATITEELRSGKTEITDTNRLMDLWTLANPLQQAQRDRGLRLRVLKQHFAAGETVNVHWAADEIIARETLAISKGSPAYIELCQRLQRAEIAALKTAEQHDAGEPGTEPTDRLIAAPTPSQKIARAKPGEAIMDLFATFKREKHAAKSADTWDMNEKIVNLFVSFIGEQSHVTAITRKAIRDWKVALDGWPIKAADVKVFDGLSFKDTVRKNKTLAEPKPGISDRTKNKYLSAMGSFCTWLLVNEHIPNDVIKGMAVSEDKERRKRRSFDADQLALIFGSPLFSACAGDRKEHVSGEIEIRDWRYWVPVIALYTGARLGEICQLLTNDVRQIGGVWAMHITEEGGDGKRVKTDGSQRVVPLHPKLIELGLPALVADRLAAKEMRLFTQLKRNGRMQFGEPSRFFRSFLARVGAKVDGDRGATFHSLRHGFTDALRRAGYRDDEFKMLLGHTKGTITARYGNLREGEVSALKRMIDAIEFVGLLAR